MARLFAAFIALLDRYRWLALLAIVVGIGIVGAIGTAIEHALEARRPKTRFYDQFPNADRPEADLADFQAKADRQMVLLRQSGVIVDCAKREADMPALLWTQLSTTEKRGAVVTLATHCRVPRFTVRDAATARPIARLSAGAVSLD